MFHRLHRSLHIARATLGIIWLIPGMASALALTFKEPSVTTFSQADPLSSYALPTGPWADGSLPTREVEGPLTVTAWKIDAPGATTLELLAPLRAQLEAQGYRVLWQCETDACGGFDFRYATRVLPEPDMHVDLGDFRFLAAEQDGPDGPTAVSVLVSRSAENGFVQMIAVGGTVTVASADEPLQAVPEPVTPPDLGDLVEQLLSNGAVALDDLQFDTGSANLGAGDFPSLDALAAFLKGNPEKTVVLVGHTDASGGLAGNTALSKERASSVRSRLTKTLGVSEAQVSAEGVGYLAPRASNLTEDGRARNRRVEVVLTSTQ